MNDLQDLLDRLGIRTWDVLLVGDGSGNQWGHPVGWSVAIADLITGHREVIRGGMSSGTINAVELFPYLYALRYHYFSLYKMKVPRIMQVHIISDSEVTVRCGRGTYARKKNRDLWSLVDFWSTQGYNLHWHYVAAHVEDEPKIHVLMDKIAGESRAVMELAPSSYDLEQVF